MNSRELVQQFGQCRCVVENGEPYFVAKDICDLLGIRNSRDTLAECLDDDEMYMKIIHTPGGPQELATVNESGLYSLIFRSRKPQAKEFRKWVTMELLPLIREVADELGKGKIKL